MSREKRIDPANWASLKPFGIGEAKPNNYHELWRAFKENRDNAAYAWRILTQGTCDGCALGTVGLRDWTLPEVHLCNVRLRLLRLNTMGALDPAVLADVEPLRAKQGSELRELGRLPYPMVRRRGESGFTRLTWDQALDLIATRIRATAPDRLAVYLTSRGTPNEGYYAAQKATRAMGTNNVDNAARVCHSPSTVALKQALGVGATTCSYTDWIGSDLVVFLGSNVANNQPVAMKYLYHAKKAGTKVVTVNSYREPGMERYWVPSNAESAVFGTTITDRFFMVNTGGDLAFLTGTLKEMLANGWVDHDFIAQHTTGFDAVRADVEAQDWAALEASSGSRRSEMHAFAELLGGARTAVLVWSMGITQHATGEDNVRAIINLALAKGFVGRDKCGLMPIRGHSGVQGGAEMGAYATVLPGGVPLDAEHVAQFSQLWGFPVPATPGLTAPEMIGAAGEGRIDVLLSSGGNFREVLPDPAASDMAMARIPLRVHIDIVLSGQMLTDPGEVVVLLPAATRYETPGGVTETSTERRVIFSPEITGPRIGEARPEWAVFTELAQRVRPDLAELLAFDDGTAGIRRDIDRCVPLYAGIQHLAKMGDQFQYGGPMLCRGWRFDTPDGRAHWSATRPSVVEVPEGHFRVATRRGKQFNSMVQAATDSLTGAGRDAVLISQSDAGRLGLDNGDAVVLRSDVGDYPGRAFLAPILPGNLQVYWPEAQVLLDRNRRSPESGIPDYNAVVTLERI